MNRSGSIALSISFACAVLASMAGTSTAVAAAGDIAWSVPGPVVSVDYDSGRLFAVGVESDELVVSAYKARNGKLVWYDRVGFGVEVGASQITANDDVVVVAGSVGNLPDSDWLVLAFDREDGDRLWTKIIPGDLSGFTNGVTIVDDYIVIAGTEMILGDPPFGAFVVRGLDLETGVVLWEKEDEPKGWSFGDAMVAYCGDDEDDDDDGECDDDGLAIAFGLIDGGGPLNPDVLVRAYDPATGDTVWEDGVATGGPDIGGDNIVIDKGVVYIAVNSFPPFYGGPPTWQVRAFDAGHGTPLWTMNYGIGFAEGLAAGSKRLAVTAGGGILGIEVGTGALPWSAWYPDYYAVWPVIDKGRVSAAGVEFVTFSLRVETLKAKDWTPAWTTDVPGAFPHFGTNPQDSVDAGAGLVFVGGTQLTAFKLY